MWFFRQPENGTSPQLGGDVGITLFQFGFFIQNMLAGNGIEFFDFQFSGHGAFVFCGGVEMAGAGR